jgi:hypothetical protein
MASPPRSIMSEQLIENCSNCHYLKAMDATSETCHRFPPTFAGESSPRENHHWRFPVVSPYAWCGEYRQRQNAQTTASGTSS